jgi:dephospho-CoA kinase
MTISSRRIIGLTGGIATGKTTVSQYLADVYRLPILDADFYAREAVKLGSPTLTQIFNRYGSLVQFSDGTLNRQQLGNIIFNDLQEKQWLESLIHPYVRTCLESQIKQMSQDTIVLVIPLLFEAKMTDLVTEIWVVSCSYEEQIKRLTVRDNLSEEQARARIANQFSIEDKMAAADVVLDNSQALGDLYQQIALQF